jgi:chromosome segregation ATPase
MSKACVRFLVAPMCVLAGLVTGVSAQVPPSTATPAPSGIEELLVEVRALRAELNHAAGASIRAQLLVARLQLQEQRINVVAGQLAEARRFLSTEESKAIGGAAELKRFEELANSGSVPPEERKAVADLIPNVKEQVAQTYRQLEQLRTQEADLANQLASEQGRWVEFNARLDALERSLPAR